MPSFDDVVVRIEQEQSRRSLMNPPQAETTLNQAFKTQHTPNPNPRGPAKTKGAAATDWCDHCKRAGHNREGCWVLHPHLRPVRNKGGWGGGKSGGKIGGRFIGLSKGSNWGNERIETAPSESINPNPRGRYEHRAEGFITPRDHPGEGLSVAPTAQLAQLMSQLSNLLQQHAAGSAKTFNFCGIFKLLEKYGPKFANFCQNKNKWIVDSGATDHMTCDPNQLQNLTKLKEPQYVTVANGNKTKILGTGTTNFLNKNVKDVLYLPDFNSNLLSVRKITQDLNCDVIFSPNKVTFQDRVTWKKIGEGMFKNGLYYLEDTIKKALFQ
jgi:hypothetical protein